MDQVYASSYVSQVYASSYVSRMVSSISYGVDQVYVSSCVCVELCKTYGVGQVYVSGITYRLQYVKKITEINNYRQGRQYANNYSFIENDNITKEDLYHGAVHLYKFGTCKLATNCAKQ